MCVQDLSPWEYCPRSALRRALALLKDEFNLELCIGYESEFVLTYAKDGAQADSTTYCLTSSWYNEAVTVMDNICEALKGQVCLLYIENIYIYVMGYMCVLYT